MIALGVDIGGTSVKLAALDGDGAAKWTGRAAHAGDVLRAVKSVTPSDLRADAIGLCVPGLLDDDGRAVRLSVNVPALNGMPLSRIAAAACGEGKPLHVASDATAAAFDLYTARGLQGRLFLLAIGTGVGAAVLDDGTPLHVDGDSPGHFGQLDVSLEGPAVVGPDGGAGGLEGYVSGPALERLYGSPHAWLSRMQGKDLPVRALARAIRIAHAIYLPHHVVLAGGIGIRLGPVLPGLRALIEDRLTRIARPGWTLAVGDDDFHAARGAARLALKQLTAPP